MNEKTERIILVGHSNGEPIEDVLADLGVSEGLIKNLTEDSEEEDDLSDIPTQEEAEERIAELKEEQEPASLGERVEGVVREHYRPAGRFTGLLLGLYGAFELWTGMFGGVRTVLAFLTVSLVLYTGVTIAQNSRFVRGDSDE